MEVVRHRALQDLAGLTERRSWRPAARPSPAPTGLRGLAGRATPTAAAETLAVQLAARCSTVPPSTHVNSTHGEVALLKKKCNVL